MNTHTIVVDIHQNLLKTREDTDHLVRRMFSTLTE